MALAKPNAKKDVEESNETETVTTQATSEVETHTEQITQDESTHTEPQTESAGEPANTNVVARETTAVAASSGSFQQQMAEQGLEGLDLGFGAFPILKIVNEGRFEDEDENDYGTQFIAVVQSSRIKHLYRQAGSSEGDVSYSYDGVNLLNPTENGATTLDGLKREYEEFGYDLEIKDYLEVVVLMRDPDSDYDGEMFILSVPPASRNKFSGVMATMQLKGKDVKDTPVLFSVGKKRKSKRGNASYFPWAFKIA